MFLTKDEEEEAWGQYYEQQAQIQSQDEADVAEQEYLNSLVVAGDVDLYAMEMAIKWLSSRSFENANLSPAAYLLRKRDELLDSRRPKPEPEVPANPDEPWDDLPF